MDCSNPECVKLKEELQALKSTGYDMLKQTGSWQSCGATPDDLSRKFCEFFDHEVYSMKEILQESSVKEDVAREILSMGVQESYDICRREILREMMKTLERVVPMDQITSINDDEALYDATRAYGLLLSASGLADSKSCRVKKISKQVHDRILLNEGVSSVTTSKLGNIQEFANESSELSWDLLTTVPPLVSVQPKSFFFKEWHEKEVDSWTDDLDHHELVYYRPILFRSCAGNVALKAIVGNRRCDLQSSDRVQGNQLEEDRISSEMSVLHDENKVLELEVSECETTNQQGWSCTVRPSEVESLSHTLISSNILQKQLRVQSSHTTDSIWHQSSAHKFTSTCSAEENGGSICAYPISNLISDKEKKPKSCYDKDISSVEAETHSLTDLEEKCNKALHLAMCKPTDHEFQIAETEPQRTENPGISRGTITLGLVIKIIMALFTAIFFLFCVDSVITQTYQKHFVPF